MSAAPRAKLNAPEADVASLFDVRLTKSGQAA
jgi:hypothetical protein